MTLGTDCGKQLYLIMMFSSSSPLTLVSSSLGNTPILRWTSPKTAMPMWLRTTTPVSSCCLSKVWAVFTAPENQKMMGFILLGKLTMDYNAGIMFQIWIVRATFAKDVSIMSWFLNTAIDVFTCEASFSLVSEPVSSALAGRSSYGSFPVCYLRCVWRKILGLNLGPSYYWAFVLLLSYAQRWKQKAPSLDSDYEVSSIWTRVSDIRERLELRTRDMLYMQKASGVLPGISRLCWEKTPPPPSLQAWFSIRTFYVRIRQCSYCLLIRDLDCDLWGDGGTGRKELFCVGFI